MFLLKNYWGLGIFKLNIAKAFCWLYHRWLTIKT